MSGRASYAPRAAEKKERNLAIYREAESGVRLSLIAKRYGLDQKRVWTIVNNVKAKLAKEVK